MSKRRDEYMIRGEPVPWWQAEAPFVLLVATALAAPLCVLDQGGDWHTAILAGCVVLSLPGAAIEGMVGVARLAFHLRGDRH